MSDCSADNRARRKTVNVGKVAVFREVKDDKAQALKVLEEAAEVVEAWKAYSEAKAAGEAMGVPRHEIAMGARDDLLDEIADVVQASMNLASALGIVDFTERMRMCRVRNEKRGRM